MNIQTIYTKKLRWIDVVNPGEEELAWLRANFHFHELHFKSIAATQMRPHIDHGAGYEFLVLLFPVYNQDSGEIFPGEIDLIIGDGFVITVHYGHIYSLKALFNQTKISTPTREEMMNKGPGHLLYRILEKLFRRSYPILDHMNEDISRLETDIFKQSGDGAMVSRIALMKKNIIEFRKMMKTHHYVLEKLPKRETTYLKFANSKLYYRDLTEYSYNIWDILEALKETADTIAETSQSLATHRLNEITKVISVFSAILLPATLVAFIFGVGVEAKPFRYHPYGFWIIISIMAEAALIMYLVFKRKKWF